MFGVAPGQLMATIPGTVALCCSSPDDDSMMSIGGTHLARRWISLRHHTPLESDGSEGSVKKHLPWACQGACALRSTEVSTQRTNSPLVRSHVTALEAMSHGSAYFPLF